MKNFQIELKIKFLHDNAGDISIVAQELGLTRTSLYRRMEKYGL